MTIPIKLSHQCSSLSITILLPHQIAQVNFTVMGNKQSSTDGIERAILTDAKKNLPKVGKSGKKICCSCPETKKLRDECVIMKGEEGCADLIERHKECLRAEGFTVS
mmetsp:Transcript_18401/g.42144  ORF Transcript_18401/g.42144 Transcript_18401/m.42144 type:complete len:107 (-) Transcript_18401:152-472(-)